MIKVDISNIWGEISLPDLLSLEKEIFDAHNTLMDGTGAGAEYTGWLDLPTGQETEELIRIQNAAERIRADSDVFVVIGIGGSYLGSRAAIELLQGQNRNMGKGSGDPQIYFAGNTLSTRQWNELQRLLDGKDFSIAIISKSGTTTEPAIAMRGLRWMLERKYGTDEARYRTYAITDPTDGALRQMVEEAGWETFSIPANVGGRYSVLSPAGLLPMAVAGIDPLAVLEGAAESRRDLDVRAFDNPAWLYAAARSVLARKGLNKELLCVFDHNLSAFGHWWQRQTWRHQCREQVGLSVQTALLPGDLEALDQMVSSGRSGVFETMLHFAPIAKKVPVEMDWRDYDGLGFLSGRNLDFVEAQTMAAMAETHNYAGVPVLDLDAGELVAETLGELFCFFELSSALTARTLGLDPFDCAPDTVRAAALESMGAV